jgi:hypothetical protein
MVSGKLEHVEETAKAVRRTRYCDDAPPRLLNPFEAGAGGIARGDSIDGLEFADQLLAKRATETS